MAIVLYSNGILEDYRPSKLVFTEQELVELFSEFSEIKTKRVVSLVNTWCIFGNSGDPMSFNRIASDITREAVNSHILFVHDSEINPKWNATDNILYKNYEDFVINLKKVIDEVAGYILNEFQENPQYESKADFLPQLITIGSTADKRVLFGFNPDDQTKEFYQGEEFYKFSQKVYSYISANKPIVTQPFTIYADKNAMIIVEVSKVKQFLNSLLEEFKNKEDYEICTQITKIMNDWTMVNVEEPKKRKPRKKAGDSGENINEQ